MQAASLFRRYVHVPGGAVHLRMGGAGRPVLLIPDVPGSSAALSDLGAELATQGCAFAIPDLAGAGGTSVASKDGLQGQARMIAALLDALAWERAHIVGDGVGAAVAAELALIRPDLVDGPIHLLAEPYSGDAPYPGVNTQIDTHGMHLVELWNRLRDAHIFAPAWDRSAATRRRRAVPAAARLHEIFLDALQDPQAHVDLAETARTAWSDLVERLPVPPVAIDESSPASALLALWQGTSSESHDAIERRADYGEDTGLVRDYVRVAHGQMHVRMAGRPSSRPAVLLLHANPGSAEGLEELTAHLGTDRLAVAVDMPGHGRSDALPPDQTANVTLATYAPILAEVMTGLGIERFDVYGSHTGAGIAAELAIAEPARVGNVVFDGMPLFDDRPELVRSVMEHYFLDLTPDMHGSHILRAWGMQTDLFLWWPWYQQDPAAARTNEPAPVAKTHHGVVDMLRSVPQYTVCYRAAWTWECTQRIGHVAQRSLVGTIPIDSLRAMTPRSLELMPNATDTLFDPDYAVRSEQVRAFLDGESPGDNTAGRAQQHA